MFVSVSSIPSYPMTEAISRKHNRTKEQNTQIHKVVTSYWIKVVKEISPKWPDQVVHNLFVLKFFLVILRCYQNIDYKYVGVSQENLLLDPKTPFDNSEPAKICTFPHKIWDATLLTHLLSNILSFFVACWMQASRQMLPGSAVQSIFLPSLDIGQEEKAESKLLLWAHLPQGLTDMSTSSVTTSHSDAPLDAGFIAHSNKPNPKDVRKKPGEMWNKRANSLKLHQGLGLLLVESLCQGISGPYPW
ncbi:hypothetical protein G9A89_000419 [Geosiphon pyriformis]|nr:hypothetical protein G9A89_000419 [Geosiphon pyriformis]